MHDYVNITTPPPSPTHQMTSEYPLQIKQCHVYFILFKTKLFLLGKIFGTLARGNGSSNEKKRLFTELYTIFLIIFNVLIDSISLVFGFGFGLSLIYSGNAYIFQQYPVPVKLS